MLYTTKLFTQFSFAAGVPERNMTPLLFGAKNGGSSFAVGVTKEKQQLIPQSQVSKDEDEKDLLFSGINCCKYYLYRALLAQLREQKRVVLCDVSL